MDWIIKTIDVATSPELIVSIGDFIGISLDRSAVVHLLPLFQFVLIWLPSFLAILAVCSIIRFAHGIGSQLHWLRHDIQTSKVIPSCLAGFVLKFSALDQVKLMTIGLISLPLLYASLELPKIIINHVISPNEESFSFPMTHFGMTLDRFDHLIVLCVTLLAIIVLNGALKFHLNLYSGRLAERLLRRLRLTLYREWLRKEASGRRTDVIPMIAQEVEPIGGFGGDIISQPIFQGGTFLVIVTFMFVQNPILGLAALSLLPFQLILIPFFQRRINALARRRISEIRELGRALGEQTRHGRHGSRTTTRAFRELEEIRWALYRWKFSMKAMNNFLTALTPFFFYAVGGYLVIRGQLTLGALVAVLAAFKDFSGPLRELFRYYQTLEDVRIRYRELARFCGVESNPSAKRVTVSVEQVKTVIPQST